MTHINVFLNDNSKEFIEIPLYFELHFYYYVPYVLLDDLKNLDPSCVGLLRLNRQNGKVS